MTCLSVVVKGPTYEPIPIALRLPWGEAQRERKKPGQVQDGHVNKVEEFRLFGIRPDPVTWYHTMYR